MESNKRKAEEMGSGMDDSEKDLKRIKAEIRKSNKPIMEKKRRARINNCLNELKSLILEAMKKDPIRHSKLEKADILDMTVKHLQDIQKKQMSVAMAVDPTVIEKFKKGFKDCSEEVNRYIATLDGVEPGMKQRLINHLNNYLNRVPMYPAAATNNLPFGGLLNPFAMKADEVNNNSNNRLNLDELKLIPSRLPSGEIAFIMPNSNGLMFYDGFTGAKLPAKFPPMPAMPSTNDIMKSLACSPPLSPISEDELPKTKLQTPQPKSQVYARMMEAFPTPPTPQDILKSRLSSSVFQSPQPLIKIFKPEIIEQNNEMITKNNDSDDNEDDDSHDMENGCNSDMWRPW